MNESTEIANINRLLKKAENEPHKLTDEERRIIYGAGNPNRVRYARRGDVYVSRIFGPNEKFDENEWVDSPTKLGAPETHPGATVTAAGIPMGETVVGSIGASPSAQAESTPTALTPPTVPTPAPTLSPEELAIAARTSSSPVTSGSQSDFGDVDDPTDAGPGLETGRPLRNAGGRR